jgi:hypothetical protein
MTAKIHDKTAVRATAHFGFKVLRQLSRTFPEIQNPLNLIAPTAPTRIFPTHEKPITKSLKPR